jgi:2-polyprenyl-3-methyl-5-hydroxy-6-metoxy-1,4-benzoquinol methylase
VGTCCDPSDYDRVFGGDLARRQARSYRHRGLDRHARVMVEFLAADGLAGRTVLEIGGGVGTIGVELVRNGAAAATTLELSSSYDDAAGVLAAQTGVADRVQHRNVDVATSPGLVEEADLVVLHRVVCCYPDFAALLGAAADHCRSRLAFSHPPGHAVSRGVLGIENLVHRLRGRGFRAYAHPQGAMVEVLTRHGLDRTLTRPGPLWHVQGLVRRSVRS